MKNISRQGHIQGHHQCESQGKGQDAHMGVFASRHFRNEFFDDDVAHGPGGQTEEIRQDRNDEGRQCDGQGRSDGFYDAR